MYVSKLKPRIKFVLSMNTMKFIITDVNLGTLVSKPSKRTVIDYCDIK